MLVVCTSAPRPEHESVNQIIISQPNGAECRHLCWWCAHVHLVLSTNQSINLIIFSKPSGAECRHLCWWCAHVHLVLSTNQSINQIIFSQPSGAECRLPSWWCARVHLVLSTNQSINQSDYIQSAKWSGVSSPKLVVYTRAPRPQSKELGRGPSGIVSTF